MRSNAPACGPYVLVKSSSQDFVVRARRDRKRGPRATKAGVPGEHGKVEIDLRSKPPNDNAIVKVRGKRIDKTDPPGHGRRAPRPPRHIAPSINLRVT